MMPNTNISVNDLVDIKVEMAQLKKDYEHTDEKLDEILGLLQGCSQCKIDDAVNNKNINSRITEIEKSYDSDHAKLKDLWFFVLIARNPKLALVIVVGLYGLAVSGYAGKLLGLL